MLPESVFSLSSLLVGAIDDEINPVPEEFDIEVDDPQYWSILVQYLHAQSVGSQTLLSNKESQEALRH
jgi:hypothetical protein